MSGGNIKTTTKKNIARDGSCSELSPFIFAVDLLFNWR
jgi:hypothetical protein